MIKKLAIYLISGLAWYSNPLFAQDPTLGNIDFPTSATASVQLHFLEGTLLLHSFEFEDAAEAYRAAQELAPDFAMVYWGEAMTHYHPLWDHHNAEKARAVLNKLAPSREQRQTLAASPKEKAWLEAAEILFAKGDSETQIQAYSDYLRQLYAAYPDDHEIASFYAISLLGTSFEGRDPYLYMQAAAIVEEVYADNPLHPGALHYLIHSYDDPVHAPLGMRAARRYAKVAPAAAHALHMPSHIFVARGMWDEVISSNEASSEAADARRERKNLGVDSRGYHSLHWLEYGYLQTQQVEKAQKLLNDMESDFVESQSRRAAFHLAVMRAGFLIETEDWDHPAKDIDIPANKLTQKALAVDHFVRGWAALAADNLADTRSHLEALEAMAPIHHHIDVRGSSQTSCCSPSYSTSDDDDPGTLHAIHVMTMELEALIALHENDQQTAITMLQQAAEMEGNMDFMFGPPIIVKPSHELWGETLLDAGEYDLAIQAFEQALKRAPRRRHSLEGLAAAYTQAGQLDKAKEMEGRR